MAPCGEKNYQSTLIALWAGSVMYGLYTALFAGSVYVLASRWSKRYHLAVSIALWIFITAVVVMEFVQTLLTPTDTVDSHFVGAALVVCGSEPEKPVRVREILTKDLLKLAEDVLSALSQVLADGLLIYRCYIIWDHRRRIILPLVFFTFLEMVCNTVDMYCDYEIYRIRRSTAPPAPPPPAWTQILYMSDIANVACLVLVLITTVVTTALTGRQPRFLWLIGNNLRLICCSGPDLVDFKTAFEEHRGKNGRRVPVSHDHTYRIGGNLLDWIDHVAYY
ncbi:hypothetical protein DENSPDRAFT_166871 [Dentipellis sp. KUC8613]|nr:hypothetical protein DENSPDRAFT_166871 [Dentipellis sp. KUC8613]